ncbi:helix-turn-helix domain-containing protein [Paenibacillus sp. MBLB4367]|uniref:helix-turn-helix domain-containing protein n=1 Tax=Paenibacillus sp. MBLB4367 TaxID=3384767 RepID=UPI00390802AC
MIRNWMFPMNSKIVYDGRNKMMKQGVLAMIDGLRVKRNSLFTKLLLGFIVIIVISFIFNALSFNFFTGSIREEVITYNKLNMSNTVSKYEEHFQVMEEVAANFYNNANVIVLNRDNTNFFAMNDLAKEFTSLVTNYKNLGLDNMFLYNGRHSFLVDKSGLMKENDMFANQYISPAYDATFWAKQVDEDYYMRIFPAADFTRRNFNGSIEPAGSLFPVIVKSKLQKQYYIAALLDASAIYRKYHLSVSDLFYMTDGGGTVFYSSGEQEQALSPLAFDPSKPYFTKDNNYYFYAKGEKSGLTYVNVIPNQNIASKIYSLSVVLIVLLALSLILSLIISVLLSIRFKSPIQKIIDSMYKMNPNIQLGSKINEFNMIVENLRTIIASNRSIHKDLQNKNTLLKKYGYWNKVKSIPIGSRDVQNLIDTSRPYFFVMFHIHFTRRFHELITEEQKKSHILEFIQLNVQQAFPQSETVQSEKDLIFSIVFAEPDASGALRNALGAMKHVFDTDSEYYYVTIAFNPVQYSPSGFTAAYDEAREMVRRRKLNGETQIVTDCASPQPDFHLTPSEEKEFTAHLAAGNEADIMLMIGRMMNRLRSNGTAEQYRQLAGEVVSKTLLALMLQNINAGDLQEELSPYEQIKEFVTEEQYDDFFRSLIGYASALMNEKRMEKDPIIEYVLAYMEQHYGEDIGPDAVAEKLNLSTGYMCKYVKNKTGKTFGDCLDDVRIMKAKEILEATDCKIHEVALQVGYQNANSFTRMFRRLTGVTPGEYRRERRVVVAEMQ